MKPNKTLGQHFLTSEGAVERVAEAGEILTGENILEIGPGKGVLTKALLKRGARVTAVEKDPGLVNFLKESFADDINENRLEITEAEAQKCSPKKIFGDQPYKLVANIPYYITGVILRKFLSADHKPERIVLLVQKEVADRVVSKNGKESLLSISTKVYGRPRKAGLVKAGSFFPKPAVDSAILVIEDVSGEFFKDISEKDFFSLVKLAFSSKRKQLVGNLRKEFDAEIVKNALSSCQIKEKVRAEDLSAEEFRCLAKKLT